jgi:hypothetical protein
MKLFRHGPKPLRREIEESCRQMRVIMNRIYSWTTVTFAALTFAGCSTMDSESQSAWHATEIASQDGFAVPECVVADGQGNVFVSNILPDNDVYWGDDGMGFVSRLSVKGKVEAPYWLGGRENSPIHSPKGMCILDGWLYLNDSTRLLRCKLDNPKATLEVVLSKGSRYNDLASDGRHLWISDIKEGKVIRLDSRSREEMAIPAPSGVNGVTTWEGRLFAVSWTEHEIYELDPGGKEEPRPFGLAAHFTNLDGIEVLDDGTFLVSDFKGNKVSLVSADEKTVRTLIEVESPADIGIDRKRGLLYVPQFKKDKIIVYQLKKRP